MEPNDHSRVIAAYDRQDRAREVVAHLRSQGVDAAAIRLDDPDDRAVLGREGQRQEGGTVAVAPGVVGEGRTMRGGWLHTVLWGAAGAVVGALVGLLVDLAAMSKAAEVLTFAVVGALALSSAGFVFGLGRGPDVRPGPVSSARRTILSVELTSGSQHVVDLLRDSRPDQLWEAGAAEVRSTHDQRVGRTP